MGAYLLEAGKLSPTLSKTATACPRTHAKDGIVYRAAHDPAPRFRIVFYLAQPYVFLKDGTTQAERIEEWKLRLYALAERVGVEMDESCVDPSRLFYFPTHAPGRPFESYFIVGENLLDIEALPITETAIAKAKGGKASAKAGKEPGKAKTTPAGAGTSRRRRANGTERTGATGPNGPRIFRPRIGPRLWAGAPGRGCAQGRD